MRAQSFRIRNYKSIVDSGPCPLAADLTVLVGKNESGKTATLEALRNFAIDIPRFPAEALPINGSPGDPAVEICFHLRPEEIEQLEQSSGVKLTDQARDNLRQHGLTIIKDHLGGYRFNAASQQRLFMAPGQEGLQKDLLEISSAQQRLETLMHGTALPNLDLNDGPETVQQRIRELVRLVKAFLPSIKDEATQNDVVQNIRTIIHTSKNLPARETTSVSDHDQLQASQAFLDSACRQLPRFIFFSEFSETLPFEIPLSRARDNQAVQDFAKLAGLDLNQLLDTQDMQRRINILNRHSALISGDFLDYWGQDQLELVVKPIGESLLFGIKEKTSTDFFKVRQRSRGFQWFLAFYLRLNALKEKDCVILIDEPGTNLHAKAQQEIIKVLREKISPEATVIYSTHCPYLIDPQRLDQVRLVLKGAGGTILLDHIPEELDPDTLLPITTARGQRPETAQGTPAASGGQNLIVYRAAEGYLLQALRDCLPGLPLDHLKILPAGSQASLTNLIAMLTADRQEFRVLFNHDEEGQQLAQELKRDLGLTARDILFVSQQPNLCLVDLLSRADFAAFFLTQPGPAAHHLSNSQYLQANGVHAVRAAKDLLEKVTNDRNSVSIDHQTRAAFERLFRVVSASFEKSPGPAPLDFESPLLPGPEKPAEEENTPPPPPKRRSFLSFLWQD